MKRKTNSHLRIASSQIKKLQREIERLREFAGQPGNRKSRSLCGILGKVSISGTEIERAKRSLFPSK